MARPTHSNVAPQFAFHKFSRRYAFAMISIGIAVRIRIGPAPYAVAVASPAMDKPTVAAGADDAIPMTVSCATPIALGSSLATGAEILPATDAADRSDMPLPLSARTSPAPAPRPGYRHRLSSILWIHLRIFTEF